MTVTLESFANNASTTLSAAITDTTGTSISVTSASGFPSSGNYRIVIDSEYFVVTGGQGTTTWTVTRGAESSTAATHSNSAAVTQVLTNGGLLQARSDLYLLDTFANRPSAGVAGRLFKSSDGERIWRDNGSSWEVFNFGATETAVPTSSWSWDNQNSATITDNTDGMSLIKGVTNNSQWAVRYRTIQAAPYTLVVMIDPQPSLDNNSYWGVNLRDSSSGKYIHFYQAFANADPGVVVLLDYNSAINTFSSNKVSVNPGKSPLPYRWMKIKDDNTNRSYHISQDGLNWIQVFSAARTDYITPDGCGFGVATASSTYPIWAKIKSWLSS